MAHQAITLFIWICLVIWGLTAPIDVHHHVLLQGNMDMDHGVSPLATPPPTVPIPAPVSGNNVVLVIEQWGTVEEGNQNRVALPALILRDPEAQELIVKGFEVGISSIWKTAVGMWKRHHGIESVTDQDYDALSSTYSVSVRWINGNLNAKVTMDEELTTHFLAAGKGGINFNLKWPKAPKGVQQQKRWVFLAWTCEATVPVTIKSGTSSPLDLTRVREDVNSHFRLNGCSAVCVAVGPSIVPSTPTVSFPREASLYIRGPIDDVFGRYFLPLGYQIQTSTAQFKGREGNVSATVTRNGGITCLGCNNGRITGLVRSATKLSR